MSALDPSQWATKYPSTTPVRTRPPRLTSPWLRVAQRMPEFQAPANTELEKETKYRHLETHFWPALDEYVHNDRRNEGPRWKKEHFLGMMQWFRLCFGAPDDIRWDSWWVEVFDHSPWWFVSELSTFKFKRLRDENGNSVLDADGQPQIVLRSVPELADVRVEREFLAAWADVANSMEPFRMRATRLIVSPVSYAEFISNKPLTWEELRDDEIYRREQYTRVRFTRENE